ncbi:hypothetical protein ACFO25_04165 [Paenactinomyces guangxiensis]|uniref:DUF2178 domain-containing protein n=1 Tax=Paenactinomyces guangxiensis TaxID=1490290 RepID=A0A7W2A7Q5_9BACL|nr:hypothetical protein [Paenactinomyces guangxiensis]MBA4493352.1 hypothetical protein [Paenactinomyces guangxiensis]MBH8593422.1 hypothetical protein [Paenactinomyces guangxiensis]
MTKNRSNIAIIIILGSISIFLAIMYIADFINGMSIEVSDIIVWVLLLTSWFQFLTWGSDNKIQKDEMGKQIAATSAKISYHILTGSLFLLWILDRIIFVRKNEFGNISLLAALCLAIVIFPVIQFFIARRYR